MDLDLLPTSRVANPPTLPEVLLRRGQGYDHGVIGDFVEEGIRRFRGSGGLHGYRVLLKPNLISANGPAEAVTHPAFLVAVAEVLRDCGARLSLGDSPALGSARRVCAKRGIAKALQGMEVELLDFVAARPVRLRGGLELPIAEAALRCDLLVGLPKVKAHNQMLVTLATKNLFGVVKGVRKAMLHMSHGTNHQAFAEILCDLPEILPPQLHFADGIVAMHRSGPLDGDPLALYCMAAAESPLALDTALLSVLELDHARSPLWRVAAKRGLCGWDPRGLAYPGLAPQAFHGSGFLAPSHLNPVRFNAGRFLRGLWRRALLRVRPFSV